MTELHPSPESQDILLVDSDGQRAAKFLQLLTFVKLKGKVIKPSSLLEYDHDQLDQYQAIFTVADDEVRQFMLENNKAHQCQYPLVLLAEKEQLDQQQIVVHLPYITASCFAPDYFSLRQVLDQLKNHNKRERRLSNRTCQQLIGRSPAITFINHMVGQVADTTASVLILGESGTGKEVIARNIHAQSNRSDKPFIPINCGAIPSELLGKRIVWS